MLGPASELSRVLASNVEAVCQHYLPNGRRCSAYWTVGDVFQHARAHPQPPQGLLAVAEGLVDELDLSH